MSQICEVGDPQARDKQPQTEQVEPSARADHRIE
jgi:hypothetical protein